MAAIDVQLAGTALVVASAALMMAFTGAKKKMLRWKPSERRCQTCGRTDRYNCPCRR